MKRIVILSNHDAYTYNFRREIIQNLMDENFKIFIVLPFGEKVLDLERMGCVCIDLPLDRRGMNPYTDLKLLSKYNKIMKKIKPAAVLSFTIKPNIYGGLVCRKHNIPFFPNVTGLGTAVENEGLVQKLLIKMYKFAYKKASCVFFQNEANRQFFRDKGIKVKNARVIPGSGVNTTHFSLLPYPSDNEIHFMFISRIMKEKGINQYLDAAKYIKAKYPNTVFHVLGYCEQDYQEELKYLQSEGIIHYHGMQSDVREFHKFSHCTIHPTYYPEGMSNVLLESASCGRPIITTDRIGCKEIVDDGLNGYLVNQKDTQDLINKIEKFLALTYEEKRKMGKVGRTKIEKSFDREIVVDNYMIEICNLKH